MRGGLGKVLIEKVPIFQALDESPDIHAWIASCSRNGPEYVEFGFGCSWQLRWSPFGLFPKVRHTKTFGLDCLLYERFRKKVDRDEFNLRV